MIDQVRHERMPEINCCEMRGARESEKPLRIGGTGKVTPAGRQ